MMRFHRQGTACSHLLQYSDATCLLQSTVNERGAFGEVRQQNQPRCEWIVQ